MKITQKIKSTTPIEKKPTRTLIIDQGEILNQRKLKREVLKSSTFDN
jgi:hypothetical protein